MRPLLLITLFLLLSVIHANDETDQSINQSERGSSVEIHPERPKPVKEDQSINQLVDWCINHGYNITGVEIADTVRKGRGLIASTNLSISQSIISLPFGSLITHQWIIEHSPIASLLTSNTHQTDAFALYLASQRSVNQSIHRAYIDSLPDFVPLPLFYSDYLMANIKNTTLQQIAHSRRQIAYRTYSNLDDVIKQSINKADFMWALSIVWSRSFGAAKYDQSISQWKSVATLIPFVDFFNTGESHEINVKCKTSQQGRAFTCRTTQSINQGDELLVSYGERSNSQLLHDYGFAMFTPVNDLALFTLPSPSQHRVTGMDQSINQSVNRRKTDVQDALSRTIKNERRVFTLKAPAVVNSTSFDSTQSLSTVIPDPTFGWARLCVIDHADYEELLAHEMIDRIHVGEMFSANNELRAVKLINQSIIEALSHFPQTIESDLAALNDGELVATNAALFWITLMRFYEKSILVDVSSLIEETIPDLQLEAVKETAARQSMKARKAKELEEKEAREIARKAERQRLQRDENHDQEGEDADELEFDEDDDDLHEAVKLEVPNSAAWKKREL